MNEPGFTDEIINLSQSRIAIMGLGLMGGSLAMAITRQSQRNYRNRS